VLLWLLAPVLLGGGLRLVAMEQTFPTRPIGDEIYYLGTAINIAEGRGHFYNRHTRAFRPPAFPFLLSRFIDVDRPHGELDPRTFLPRLDRLDPANPDPGLREFLYPLTLLQVLLGTALVALTALLGRALFDARTGLLAGFVAAVYPTFIAFSHYLWSDALFAVLITGALIGVVRGETHRGWVVAASTGAVFGAAALARQFAIPIAGTCALWWLWTARPADRWTALRQGAVMLGVAALVILPWTYRNYTIFHRFVPVATVGSLAMAGGNTLESPDWRRSHGPAQSAFNQRYFAIHDEMERADFSRGWTRDRLREQQPTWIFKKTLRNLPLLLGPDSIVFYKIERGAYGEVPTAVMRPLAAATTLSYALVIVGGVLGIAVAAGRGRRLLPGLLLGIVLLVHVVTTANSRHRLPWMPLVIAYASFAVLQLPTVMRHGLRRRGV
jgi:4-amino-4-deoxy-L-arabinose transferase-like glycosyltransferase